MKTTIHERNNPFAVFLAGVALAAVLGLTLMLSAPSHAQEQVAGTSTGIFTRATFNRSGPSDGDVGEHDSVRNLGGRVYTTTATSADTDITTTWPEVMSGEHTGVYVTRTGDGNVTLTNSASFKKTINYGIEVTHSGAGKLTVVNGGKLKKTGVNGINAIHSGGATATTDDSFLKIQSTANIDATNNAVNALHSGVGNIEFVTDASIKGSADAVYLKHTNSGSVVVKAENKRNKGGSITATDTGNAIFVRHEGSVGDIDVDIASQGSVTSEEGDAIDVEHAGASSGKIDLDLQGAISSSRGRGVSAIHNGAGNVEILASSSIDGYSRGIFAKHSGTGSLLIDINAGGAVEAAGKGIAAIHEGSSGGINIDVAAQGSVISNANDAMSVELKGTGNDEDIDLDIFGEVRGADKAISAVHSGTGDIDIDVWSGASVTATNEAAIYARRKGGAEGQIYIDVLENVTSTSGNAIEIEQDFVDYYTPTIQLERIFVSVGGNSTVSGGDIGISVTHNGSTNYDYNRIIVYPGSSVSGGSVGIRLHTNHGGGGGAVELHGAVSSSLGSAGTAIDFAGGLSAYVFLYPGFSLDGKVVASRTDSTPVFFLGAKMWGETKITLSGDDPSLTDILDFSVNEFHGFKMLSVFGRGRWILTGATSEREVFEWGYSNYGGVVRFSNLDFRMTEDGYFYITTGRYSPPPVKLEISGINRLRGSLTVGEGIVAFVQEEDASGSPTSRPITQGSLTVDKDYAGGDGSHAWGFNVDLVGQLANSLTIKGDISDASNGLPHTPGRVWMRTHTSGDSGASSSPVQESPTLITVVGTALSTDFWGDQNIDDLYHYDLMHRTRTVAVDGVNRNVNQWYFNYAGLSATAGTVASMPQGMFDAMAPGVAPPDRDGETPDPNPAPGLRADTREYVGGVWVQQQSLRASPASIGITNSRSRTEGNRVHFGYDIPAVNFMGGDMVVGTNAWYGLSTSDVSSPNGEGGIGFESQAAGLTASWQSPVGFYADGYTQYVRFSGDVSAENQALVRDNEGIGVSASAEAGYRFALSLGGMDFGVTPQAQLLWSSVDFEDFFGPQGGLISLEDGDLVTGRLGLSWDGEWQDIGGSGRVYGGVNLHEAVDGRTSVSVSGVSLASEQGMSVDGSLGLSYEWDEGYEVHGAATALRRDDAEEIRADLRASIDF